MDNDGNESLNNTSEDSGQGATVSGSPGHTIYPIGPWGPWDNDIRCWVSPGEQWDELNPNERNLEKIGFGGIFPSDVLRWEEEYVEYRPRLFGRNQYILRKRQIEAKVVTRAQILFGGRHQIVLEIGLVHGQRGEESIRRFGAFFLGRKFPNRDQGKHVRPGDEIMRSVEDLRSAKVMVNDYPERDHRVTESALSNQARERSIGRRLLISPPRRSEYDGSIYVPKHARKGVVRTKREKYYPEDLVGAMFPQQFWRIRNPQNDKQAAAQQAVPPSDEKGESPNQGQAPSRDFIPFHPANVIRIIDGKPTQGPCPLAEIAMENAKIQERAQEIASQNDYIEGQENMNPDELRRAQLSRDYDRKFGHLHRADARTSPSESAASVRESAASPQAQASAQPPAQAPAPTQAQAPAPAAPEQSQAQSSTQGSESGPGEMSSTQHFIEDTGADKVDLDEKVDVSKGNSEKATRKRNPGQGDDSPDLDTQQ